MAIALRIDNIMTKLQRNQILKLFAVIAVAAVIICAVFIDGFSKFVFTVIFLFSISFSVFILGTIIYFFVDGFVSDFKIRGILTEEEYSAWSYYYRWRPDRYPGLYDGKEMKEYHDIIEKLSKYGFPIYEWLLLNE